jgi:hypothetical protein
MSGSGAGRLARVFISFALWYRGVGRPVRWLVTITGAPFSSSVASATNSNATSTERELALARSDCTDKKGHAARGHDATELGPRQKPDRGSPCFQGCQGQRPQASNVSGVPVPISTLGRKRMSEIIISGRMLNSVSMSALTTDPSTQYIPYKNARGRQQRGW